MFHSSDNGVHEPLIMIDLLSREHRILEKPCMEHRPFGVDVSGKMIRDASGIKIRAYVDYLEETVAAAKGPDVGAKALDELTRLLNERIPDPAYHVTPEFLRNVWNSYWYEFLCFLGEFCKAISPRSGICVQGRQGKIDFADHSNLGPTLLASEHLSDVSPFRRKVRPGVAAL